jgi:dihydrofolate reductase
MAKLIYSVIMSLDGYIADNEGNFDWAEPDEEVHSFVNEIERSVGTYLYGRRMYQVMAAWQTMPTDDQPSYIAEYASIWRAADKVVYSKTLNTVSTSRTRIERIFDPEAVRRIKASTPRDMSIGGPELAAYALKADLVDICQLFIAPIMVGGGKSAFPRDITVHLALQHECRFRNGVVYIQYACATKQAA